VPVTIATFNVNSIKSRLQNTLDWLDSESVDIVLLQELKCVDDAFPAIEFEERGYNIATHGQKTYNGVAILSKHPLEDIQRGFNDGGDDAQARYIEAVVSLPDTAMRVASVYVPNGQAPDSDKFAYKMDFYARLGRHWKAVLRHEEIAVLGGDFNCAPDPIDVYDPAALEGTICYHQKET
jgi:exodeoxyribonuclease-3